MTESNLIAIYRHEFSVPMSAVDQNGHVNNVVYVQWMQDVAILHSEANGGSQAMHKVGATWVVRYHKIEYLNAAFAGEEVTALTWVVNFRRARSLRRYRFLRKSNDTVLAEAETEWVFVDAKSGRPMKIPDDVMRLFPLVAENEKPLQYA